MPAHLPPPDTTISRRSADQRSKPATSHQRVAAARQCFKQEARPAAWQSTSTDPKDSNTCNHATRGPTHRQAAHADRPEASACDAPRVCGICSTPTHNGAVAPYDYNTTTSQALTGRERAPHLGVLDEVRDLGVRVLPKRLRRVHRRQARDVVLEGCERPRRRHDVRRQRGQRVVRHREHVLAVELVEVRREHAPVELVRHAAAVVRLGDQVPARAHTCMLGRTCM